MAPPTSSSSSSSSPSPPSSSPPPTTNPRTPKRRPSPVTTTKSDRDRRPSTAKSSPASLRKMPAITEDDDVVSNSGTFTYQSGSNRTSFETAPGGNGYGNGGNGGPQQAPPMAPPYVTRGPLRVPVKSYRRSLQRSNLPSYVPSTYIQQQQMQKEHEGKVLPNSLFAEKMKGQAPEGGVVGDEYDYGEKGDGDGYGSDIDAKDGRIARLMMPWRKAERRGTDDERRMWCKLMVAVALLGALIIALAVGLTVGLRAKHHSNNNNPSSPQPSSPANAVYPAGSYAFNTTLQNTDTSCTSDPSTWRCYPYTQGMPATFFWVINNSTASSSSSSSTSSPYTISSSNNPFAPSFTNLSTTLLDAGSSTERLLFSFSMNRTVIPSTSIDSTNRAAKCTFSNTTFEATIWTRRTGGGSTTLSSTPKGSTNWGAWPADVEVKQAVNATLGQPHCVDDQGNTIADVMAGVSECDCEYASFNLS